MLAFLANNSSKVNSKNKLVQSHALNIELMPIYNTRKHLACDSMRMRIKGNR